jgi:hypothetical protein
VDLPRHELLAHADSPSSKTVKSVAATRSIVDRNACMIGVDPTSGAAPSRRIRC